MERPCFLVSDLHGDVLKFRSLADQIRIHKPSAVFLAGDLFPSGLYATLKSNPNTPSFSSSFLVDLFEGLRQDLDQDYPAVFLVPGNDDMGLEADTLSRPEFGFLWKYMHMQVTEWKGRLIFGYACIPPSPFLMKDFERYDVSQYLDPGCIAPEEGIHTLPVNRELLKRQTIQRELAELTDNLDLEGSIALFHCPPYQTLLDRAELDGQFYEHVPLDVHIGSIAIKRFIEKRKPNITLHGHVHESARLTGHWHDRLEATHAYSAAHDGPELALVIFDPDEPDNATRLLITG